MARDTQNVCAFGDIQTQRVKTILLDAAVRMRRVQHEPCTLVRVPLLVVVDQIDFKSIAVLKRKTMRQLAEIQMLQNPFRSPFSGWSR